jgi:hypothetical protein
VQDWIRQAEERAKRHRKWPTVMQMVIDGKSIAEVNAVLDALDRDDSAYTGSAD